MNSFPSFEANLPYGLEEKYANLAGKNVNVGNICFYIQEEKKRLEREMLTISKEDSQIDTVAHDTLLRCLSENVDLDIASDDVKLTDFKNMTAREWRMLLGILGSSGGPESILKSHANVDHAGLSKVVSKIKTFVDNYIPPENSPMYGWTVPVYNRDGSVLKYEKPPYLK